VEASGTHGLVAERRRHPESSGVGDRDSITACRVWATGDLKKVIFMFTWIHLEGNFSYEICSRESDQKF
jgi:hypothetical protein